MMSFMFVALFSKQQLRPVIKHDIVPAITPCFNEAGSGVANLDLAFDGTSTRLTVALKGIEGDALSDDIRTCVRATLQTLVLPPIEDDTTGDVLRTTGEVVYPFTYALAPPDNHDLVEFHRAQQAGWDDRYADALASAEAALKLTSLDGQHRRYMIRVAGIAACHLDAGITAARYEMLASPTDAMAIRGACSRTPSS